MRRSHKAWTDTEDKKLFELVNEGLSAKEVAGAFPDRSLSSIEHRVRRSGKHFLTQRGITAVNCYQNNIAQGTDLMDEPQLIKQRAEIYDKLRFDNQRVQVVSATDFHVPFQREDLIEKLLKIGGDVVVISELLDFYSLSTFRKSKLISFKDELSLGVKLLERLKKSFKHIVLYESNHELRLWKLLQDRLQDYPEIIGYFKDQSNPLKSLAKDLGVMCTESWWVKVGDIIFCHPDWFSNVNLRTVHSTYDYFNLEGIDFNVIINAHTHHQGYTPWRNKLLFESGCLSYRMDYLRQGRRRIETHPGFIVCQLDDNKFQFNESKMLLYPVK